MRCPPDFQPSVRVCLAILAEVKKLDFSIADERLKLILSHPLGRIAPYLREAELKYSIPMVDVLTTLQDTFAKISPEVTAAVLEKSNPETIKTISTNGGQLGFQTTAGVSRRVILQCKAPGFSYFVIQSRLLLYTRHKLETDWATHDMADLVFCALLPSAKHLCLTHTPEEELAMLETLLEQFGTSVLWDSPRVTETRTHQTFERHVASRWLIFLGVITDIWSNADTGNGARDDLILRKMTMCLKSGADPNVRELRNKASPPMLVRLLRTASSMVGLRSSPHTLVYQILELFLKHGANLRKVSAHDRHASLFTLRRDIYTSLDDDAWQLAKRFGYIHIESPPEHNPEAISGTMDTPWV